jgi:hypothetical protein
MAIAAAALSQFGRQVQVLHLGLEADSDQLGRSTLNLAVVVAAQGSVDWPSAGHIDHLGYIGCQQAPFWSGLQLSEAVVVQMHGD